MATKSEIDEIIARDGCSRRSAFRKIRDEEEAIETVLRSQEQMAAKLLTEPLFDNPDARAGADRLLKAFALNVPEAV
jgi:hypothetical protein